MPRLLLSLILLASASLAQASVSTLLPRPRQLTETRGSFKLHGPVRLATPTQDLLLNQFLLENGCSLRPDAARSLRVEILPSIPGLHDYPVPGIEAEGYTLTVTPKEILIRALSPLGITRAAATLMQLADGSKGRVPAVEIVDYPSFKVRGYLLDIGRSFISVPEIKHELDLLARFKINYFHWHLTENQAWRLEIKRYPQLTAAESMTRHVGKFYTQAQCREVIDYAKARGILVIPEIDMPGHSQAFNRAMGYGMASAEGRKALKNILAEVAEVFRESPFIHIGADETAVTQEFIQEMTACVHALGKKAMTWNPISQAVSQENGIDACQLWTSRGRAVPGMINIESTYNYSNLHDMFADLVGVFNSNVHHRAEGDSEVVGSVAAVWTDRLLPQQSDYIRHNNFWALMLANAERLWCGGREQHIEQCGTHLPATGPVFQRFADWERRFLYYKGTWLHNEPIPYVQQSNITWRYSDKLANAETFENFESKELSGAGTYLRHPWSPVLPTLFPDAQNGSTTVYAWTYVYSPREQEAGAIVEFQTYERSWHDMAPEAGQWDKRGSRIWLNDEELAAPQWQSANQPTTFETLMTDENWTMRPPLAIRLKKGWNTVLVKLPYVIPNNNQVRLNRWMWTFVITTPDGRNALPGLVYSPEKRRK